MKLHLIGHEDRYAVEQLQMSLFPDYTTEYTESRFTGEDGAVSALHRGKIWLTAITRITIAGKTAAAVKRLRAAEETVAMRRRILQQSYYLAAIQLMDAPPAWGAMAGVRPTKLTTKHLLQGGTPRSADRMMRDVYYVAPERRRLSVECSVAAKSAFEKLEKRDISLYVGIPFCPTRCAYCSFVSNSIEKSGYLMEPFLETLEKEIIVTGQLLRESGLRVRSVYMGGGTPTTLTTEQISRLMDLLAIHFDLSEILEYTVEGGRPDTLTPEKLTAIREHGCDRMSINPQTMSDLVLSNIGRCHDREAVLRAYEDAVRAGFPGINMDLIAGLPGDDEAGFAASVKELIDLQPSNITVHTLALKKGADLFRARGGLPDTAAVERMLRSSERMLRDSGYLPYYLYRQKYMSGNFENVGWCKPGYEGLYNIWMMEELQSILALGGGGMNKVNLPGGRILRYHNPKYPKEYIEQIDETLRQKQEIFELLTK